MSPPQKRTSRWHIPLRVSIAEPESQHLDRPAANGCSRLRLWSRSTAEMHHVLCPFCCQHRRLCEDEFCRNHRRTGRNGYRYIHIRLWGCRASQPYRRAAVVTRYLGVARINAKPLVHFMLPEGSADPGICTQHDGDRAAGVQLRCPRFGASKDTCCRQTLCDVGLIPGLSGSSGAAL